MNNWPHTPDPCEWDPVNGRPALVTDERHADATVSLGNGLWHLCARCAALREFDRFPVLQRKALPPGGVMSVVGPETSTGGLMHYRVKLEHDDGWTTVNTSTRGRVEVAKEYLNGLLARDPAYASAFCEDDPVVFVAALRSQFHTRVHLSARPRLDFLVESLSEVRDEK